MPNLSPAQIAEFSFFSILENEQHHVKTGWDWAVFEAYLKYLERLTLLNPMVDFAIRETILPVLSKQIAEMPPAHRSMELFSQVVKNYLLALRLLVRKKIGTDEDFEYLRDLMKEGQFSVEVFEALIALFELLYQQEYEKTALGLSTVMHLLQMHPIEKLNIDLFPIFFMLADGTRFDKVIEPVWERKFLDWFERNQAPVGFDVTRFIAQLLKNQQYEWVDKIFASCVKKKWRVMVEQIINIVSFMGESFARERDDILEDVEKTKQWIARWFPAGMPKFNKEICRMKSPYIRAQVVIISKELPIGQWKEGAVLSKIIELKDILLPRQNNATHKKLPQDYLAESLLYQLIASIRWDANMHNEDFLAALGLCAFSFSAPFFRELLLCAEKRINNDVIFADCIKNFLSYLFNEKVDYFGRQKQEVIFSEILDFCFEKNKTLENISALGVMEKIQAIPIVFAVKSGYSETWPRTFFDEFLNKSGGVLFGNVFFLQHFYVISAVQALFGEEAYQLLTSILHEGKIEDFFSQLESRSMFNREILKNICQALLKKENIKSISIEKKIELVHQIIDFFTKELWQFGFRESVFFEFAKESFGLDLCNAETIEQVLKIIFQLRMAAYICRLFTETRTYGSWHLEMSTEEFRYFVDFYEYCQAIDLVKLGRVVSFSDFLGQYGSSIKLLYPLMGNSLFFFLRGFITRPICSLEKFLDCVSLINKMSSKNRQLFQEETRFFFLKERLVFKECDHEKLKEFVEKLLTISYFAFSEADNLFLWHAYLRDSRKIFFMNYFLSQELLSLAKIYDAILCIYEEKINGRPVPWAPQKTAIIDGCLPEILKQVNKFEFLQWFQEITFEENFRKQDEAMQRTFVAEKKMEYLMPQLMTLTENCLEKYVWAALEMSEASYALIRKAHAIERVIPLAKGMRNLAKRDFQSLYKTLLQLAVCENPKMAFNAFLLHGIPNHELSQALSKHNQAIIVALGQAQVDISLAFGYSRKENFILKEDSLLKSLQMIIWDKSCIETFLLGQCGNDTFSPSGKQFYALIQQCVDIGIFFPVVVDMHRGEPIACYWAFWGCDAVGKTYVVIDDFSLQMTYQQNTVSREMIAEKLLAFTHQYATAIGASAVLVRPFTTMHVSDFEKLPRCDTPIEKMGGIFRATEVTAVYELAALKSTRFYRWTCESPHMAAAAIMHEQGLFSLLSTVFPAPNEMPAIDVERHEEKSIPEVEEFASNTITSVDAPPKEEEKKEEKKEGKKEEKKEEKKVKAEVVNRTLVRNPSSDRYYGGMEKTVRFVSDEPPKRSCRLM